MDSIRLGAFITQLRREKNMTQKELADCLNVTDKAVSKWETGRGFPDVKLLEPLSQALGVSLVELIQGERSRKDSLTMDEAEHVVYQAMSQSHMVTARRYLRLLRWLLIAMAALSACQPFSALLGHIWLWSQLQSGAIGGAAGPTSIFITAPSILPRRFSTMVLSITAAACIVLAVRIRKLERKLK